MLAFDEAELDEFTDSTVALTDSHAFHIVRRTTHAYALRAFTRDANGKLSDKSTLIGVYWTFNHAKGKAAQYLNQSRLAKLADQVERSRAGV